MNDVLRVFKLLIARHESLRTTYVFQSATPTYLLSPDAVYQSVGNVGAFEYDLVEVDSTDIDEISERLYAQLGGRPFDIRDNLSIRTVLFCRQGRVARVLVSACHQAVDAGGIRVLCEELARLLSCAEAELEPVWQPVQQAELEATPLWMRRHSASVARLSRILRSAPSSQLTLGPGESAESSTGAVIFSSAISESFRRMSVAHRISPPTALMGCAASLLSTHMNSPSILFRSIFLRRHGLQGGTYIAPHTLNAFIPWDSGDGISTVDYLRAGHMAAIKAYRHCEYNPDSLDSLEIEVARERGVPLNGFNEFNYVPSGADSQDIIDRPDVPMRTLAAETRISLLDGPVSVNRRLFLQCSRVGPEIARISLWAADGFYPGGPAAFLVDLERLFTAIADGETSGEFMRPF